MPCVCLTTFNILPEARQTHASKAPCRTKQSTLFFFRKARQTYDTYFVMYTCMHGDPHRKLALGVWLCRMIQALVVAGFAQRKNDHANPEGVVVVLFPRERREQMVPSRHALSSTDKLGLQHLSNNQNTPPRFPLSQKLLLYIVKPFFLFQTCSGFENISDARWLDKQDLPLNSLGEKYKNATKPILACILVCRIKGNNPNFPSSRTPTHP